MIEGRTSGQSRPKPRGGSRFSSSDLQIADLWPAPGWCAHGGHGSSRRAINQRSLRSRVRWKYSCLSGCGFSGAFLRWFNFKSMHPNLLDSNPNRFAINLYWHVSSIARDRRSLCFADPFLRSILHLHLEFVFHPYALSIRLCPGRPYHIAPTASSQRRVRWSPKTGQVAKRESPFGTAGWPEVRHGKYTEEAQS